MSIRFNYQKEGFRVRSSNRTKNWIRKVISSEGFRAGDLNFIFTDREFLLNINREFLDHDYHTDVIAFNYGKEGVISGEVYIGIEAVKENANRFKTNFRDELLRVIIHAVLHLAGYDDKTDNERTYMRKKENEALRLWEEDGF